MRKFERGANVPVKAETPSSSHQGTQSTWFKEDRCIFCMLHTVSPSNKDYHRLWQSQPLEAMQGQLLKPACSREHKPPTIIKTCTNTVNTNESEMSPVLYLSLSCIHSRHAFLVYNGSVHLWRILRVLNRDGARSVLLPCFDTITKALEWAATQGVKQEEWRAHNLLALAWCLADGGQKERAVTLAQECEKLAKGEDLLAAAAGLRVHLTVGGKAGGGGKAKGEPGKDAEGQAR